MRNVIYLDNCATTKVGREALEVFNLYSSASFFNPSAAYEQAYEVRRDIERARGELIEGFSGGRSDLGSGWGRWNLVFTSGGTEANNLAVRGIVGGSVGGISSSVGVVSSGKRRVFVTTEGEHPSVYDVGKDLKARGYEVRFAKLNRGGGVDLQHLLSLIRADTALVSVIHVNNETGVVNNLGEIASAVKDRARALGNIKLVFHSDGVQAFGKLDFTKLDFSSVDLYSVSGHKLGAPKGIGGLFIRDKVLLSPQIVGGGQESGKRSGTENVAGIMAFASAFKCAVGFTNDNRFNEFKRYIKESLSQHIVLYNMADTAEHIFVFSVKEDKRGGHKGKYAKAEVLVRQLSIKGVIVGNGAACSSKIGVNRVLLAMGLSKDMAGGTLRLSFSKDTTIGEIKKFCEALKQILE
ncbi:MAG: cysteine desulfurase [Firmicutes bacterium]|nr:cysteine desulfurase [Bacillota bacterium]